MPFGYQGSKVDKQINNQHSPALMYRPEIDGLRSIAVLAVIVFHFSKNHLPGGYLGVDIFFVLSGYLIATIIWSDIQNKQFSLANFYERRIRRLVPALLVLLLFTLVVSFFILLPTDLIGFSKSLLATQTFVANIFFWRDGGYFTANSETKPLLHMWSLGVEEQFYILFPLLLMLISKWKRLIVLTIMLGLICSSYFLNVYAIHKGFSNPAFFLLPTRVWELGAGAFLALCVHKNNLKLHVAFAYIGLILIGLSIGFPEQLNARLFTPNFFTVLGTLFLLVKYPNKPSLVQRFLSLKVMVFLGLISFSLYIWHWPLIIFAKYYLVRDLTVPEMLITLILILSISVGSSSKSRSEQKRGRIGAC